MAQDVGWRTHEPVVLPLKAGASLGERVPGSGGYEQVCNLKNHFTNGMYAELDVR